jgi:transcriptional regulator with XRE-family HTH domain
MTIGERIKMRRKQLGLSADQVAERVGVNRATIYRYESDEIKSMGTETLVPLAAALRTTPAWLLTGDEDPEERDDDLMAALEKAFNSRPEMRILFSIANDATTEDVEKTIKILEALKGE